MIKKENTYGKLKTVVLGNYYTPEHFNFISNDNIKTPLKRIASEVLEDLDNFRSILEQNDVTVLQPCVASIEEFKDNFFYSSQRTVPPLQPRNNHAVIGDTIYRLGIGPKEIHECIQNYCTNISDLCKLNVDFYHSSMAEKKYCHNPEINVWYKEKHYNKLKGPDWPSFHKYVQGDRSSIPAIQQELKTFETSLQYETKELGPLQAPNLMLTEYGLVVDCNEFCNYTTWVNENINYNGKIWAINTGAGHTDGCFNFLGNNTIIGIENLIDYRSLFPNHKLVTVPSKNFLDQRREFQSMSKKVKGRWWVPGEENNDTFINFIETYLSEWTGYVEETIFDVNVLSLNKNTVFINTDNYEIRKQLELANIDTIVVPWRHRFFVDGGLHCITLDLLRD